MTSPLLINQDIEFLIAGKGDEKTAKEAAANIIAWCKSRLNETSFFRFSHDYEDKGPDIQGYSPGIGNVKLEGEDKKELKKVEIIGQTPEVRVGHYKITREPGGHTLIIRHYWASDETTASMNGQTPTNYYLGYDNQTSQMIFFAREDVRVIRVGHICTIDAGSLSVLWGKKTRRYGRNTYNVGHMGAVLLGILLGIVLVIIERLLWYLFYR